MLVQSLHNVPNSIFWNLFLFNQELEQIETIWKLATEWEMYWDKWKRGRFLDLRTKEMEDVSNSIWKKLFKMARELKVELRL